MLTHDDPGESEFYAGDVVMVRIGGRWREAVVRHAEPMTRSTWYTVSLRDARGWNDAEHPVCDRALRAASPCAA